MPIPDWKSEMLRNLRLRGSINKRGILNFHAPRENSPTLTTHGDNELSSEFFPPFDSLPKRHEMDSLAKAEIAFGNMQIKSGQEIFNRGNGAQSASEAQDLMAYQQDNGFDAMQNTDDFFVSNDDFMNETATDEFFHDDVSTPFEDSYDVSSQCEMVFKAEDIPEIDNQGLMDSLDDSMMDEPMEEMVEMEQSEPMDPMNDPFDPMNPFGMMDPLDMGMPGF